MGQEALPLFITVILRTSCFDDSYFIVECCRYMPLEIRHVSRMANGKTGALAKQGEDRAVAFLADFAVFIFLRVGMIILSLFVYFGSSTAVLI